MFFFFLAELSGASWRTPAGQLGPEAVGCEMLCFPKDFQGFLLKTLIFLSKTKVFIGFLMQKVGMP